MKKHALILILSVITAVGECQSTNPQKPKERVVSCKLNDATIKITCDIPIFSDFKSQIEPRLRDKEITGPGHGAPERIKIIVNYKHPSFFDERYDLRWIQIIPLYEKNETAFSSTYSGLASTVVSLKNILKHRPATIPYAEQIPVWDYDDATQTIHSKIQYVDTKHQTGMLFLTQDTRGIL